MKTLVFVAFFISAADIPYFNQFYSRFSITALEWLDSPKFVVEMILGEPKYFVYILLFCVFVYFSFLSITKIVKAYTVGNKKMNVWFSTAASVLFLGFIVLGIRGRLEKKSPIRVGTAYFSNNAYINQLGLNPTFTFLRSYLDSKKEENNSVKLMDDSIAIKNVREYFSIEDTGEGSIITREVTPSDSTVSFYNIVVVMMESMSDGKMNKKWTNQDLTPFLDSLSTEGIYYNNCYSAGIHTFNGIYGTLFSYPAIFRQHPMKRVEINEYNGIIKKLRKENYPTLYFTGHDGQFDNVEGFLKGNNFKEVISQKHYPNEKVLSAMGVPDDYLFEYSIEKLTSLSEEGKPFFAAILTGSDHGPYNVPKHFKPKAKNIKQQIVEYADFSLRKFVENGQKTSWYKNTLFVFVADHGTAMDSDYDLSIKYNHVPLLFYNPHIIEEPQLVEEMVLQIDILPTVMGYLNMSYVNSSLGIDLRKEKRKYSYFNVDDKIGVMDREWLLIIKNDGTLGLYRYVEKDKNNLASQYPSIVS